MNKLTAFLAAFLALTLASAFAAAPAVTAGKILAVSGSKVQIAVDGKMPDWVKKGTVIKLADETGKTIEQAVKVTEISASGLTYTAKNASAAAAGKTVKFQKGKLMSGC
jgi:LysM repeat protein